VGPAAVIGIARLQDRRVWPLVGGAVLALILADATGLSPGGVERIWLLLAARVPLATASLPFDPVPGGGRLSRTALRVHGARPRAARGVRVIMRTARGQESDRIRGLQLGADDYVAKPFSPRELVARVRSVLRRTGRADDRHPAVASGDLVLDPAARRVLVRDQ